MAPSINLQGSRVAIYGLGRSGLAIARACLSVGATPTVYDTALPEQMVKQDVLEAARELGIELRLGWGGEFDPEVMDVLVTNPAVDMRSPVLRSAKASGIRIWSEIEFAFQLLRMRRAGLEEHGSGPPMAAPIIAITGTNGKSTTTVMTYLALRECGIDAVLCGNIFGTGLPEVPMTEAALHWKPGQVLVVEVSSFQLEWVEDFRPAVAGITNIWPDHLDRYQNFEDYAATKHRIFSAQTSGDFAVVRAFDPNVRAPGSEVDSAYRGRRGGHGRDGQDTHGRDAHATVLTFGSQGTDAQVMEEEIRILDKSIRTDEMRVIGVHNYSNAAMAGLLGYAMLRWMADRVSDGSSFSPEADIHARNLLLEAQAAMLEKRNAKRNVYSIRIPQPEEFSALPEPIVTALKAFPGIEHRMELLGEKNGIKVINNSMCTNPDAVVKSAQSIKGPNHLIIGGKDKDLPWLPVKHYLANGMHKAYLFGEAKELLNDALGGGFPTYTTLQEAFQAATEKARPGEVIMLAPGCASTDQFHDFRDRGNVFKSIAREWLNT